MLNDFLNYHFQWFPLYYKHNAYLYFFLSTSTLFLLIKDNFSLKIQNVDAFRTQIHVPYINQNYYRLLYMIPDW